LDKREDKGMVLRVEDLKIIKYNESFSFRTVFDFAIKKETQKILVQLGPPPPPPIIKFIISFKNVKLIRHR